MAKQKDITGQKFERLTVIKFDSVKRGVTGDPKRYWLCKCDCGNTVITATSYLNSGHIKSCGCLKLDNLIQRLTKHGLWYHPLHGVWNRIIDRCTNENNKRYSDYGGRGITVCNEWKNDFKVFYDWATANGWNKGLQIDRENNNGNYEPKNCRFVTSLVNNNNKRNCVLVIHHGKTQNLKQWSKELNLNYQMLRNRFKKAGITTDQLFRKSGQKAA